MKSSYKLEFLPIGKEFVSIINFKDKIHCSPDGRDGYIAFPATRAGRNLAQSFAFTFGTRYSAEQVRRILCRRIRL